MGVSSKVRWLNDEHDTAKVILFRNFDPAGSVIIDQPQYSEDIDALFLKKDSDKAGWKIVSFNVMPDDIIRSVKIDPGKIIKKLIGK